MFYEHLRNGASIEHLNIGGELSYGMIADLLAALKENQHIKKITISSDIIRDNGKLCEQLKQFIEETQGRIEVQTRHLFNEGLQRFRSQQQAVASASSQSASSSRRADIFALPVADAADGSRTTIQHPASDANDDVMFSSWSTAEN